VVGADGTLFSHGSGITGVSRIGAGAYVMHAPTALNHCALVATLEAIDGTVTAVPTTEGALVSTSTHGLLGQSAENLQFSFVAIC
jgi:hypothetical protein